MNNVLTNQIIVNFNYELISRDYTICEYATSEKYIKHGAKILDSVGEKLRAKSIVFESGKKFYALFSKADDLLFNDIVSNTEFEKLCVKEVSAKEMENRVLVQLFLNALNNYETEEMKFNNLTGKLYCSNPNWLIKSSNGKIRQFKCIEVLIGKDMNLKLNVATFTSVIEFKRLKFNKKRPQEHPIYDFVGLNLLKRIDWNNQNGYIKRQYENKKNRIPFIDFSNWSKFSQSKCGVLYKVLKVLDEKFGMYLNTKMKAINEYKTIRYEDNFIQVQNLNFSKPIAIIDKLFTKDEVFVHSILTRLNEYGFCNAVINSELITNAYNIVVINNKEFYEENTDLFDPYYIGENKVIQHITYEDFDDSKAVLNCILKEMRIKQDVLDGKLTYAKWQNLGFVEPLCFCKKVSDTTFAFLKICIDGKMNFERIESDILNDSQHQNVINKYNVLEAKSNAEIECIIFCDSFCCAIICSHKYTLPQVFEIGDALKAEAKKLILSKQELLNVLSTIKNISAASQSQLSQIKEKIEAGSKAVYCREDILSLTTNRMLKKAISSAVEKINGLVLKTYFRGEILRNKLFASNLSINYFPHDNGELLYYVGEKNKGINTVLQTASLIRKVIPIYGEIDERIFNLLSVDFVNKERFTVIPFPVKYLREYCKQRL